MTSRAVPDPRPEVGAASPGVLAFPGAAGTVTDYPPALCPAGVRRPGAYATDGAAAVRARR